MDLLDAGYAFEHISATYGIHAAHLKVLRSKYLQQRTNTSINRWRTKSLLSLSRLRGQSAS